jgi:hypothetical protein
VATNLSTGGRCRNETGICHLLRDKNRVYMKGVMGHIAVYLGGSLCRTAGQVSHD